MPTPLDPGNPLYREMRELARRTFDHALAECSIPRAMQRHLELREDQLRVGNDLYDLQSFTAINVVSIGKAGHSLAQALVEITDRGLHGIVSCPSAPAAQVFGFRYFIGGHPMPNQDSFRAGEAILKLLGNSGPDTLTIFLISGGASAIAEKPISSAITLQDVIATLQGTGPLRRADFRDQRDSQTSLCHKGRSLGTGGCALAPDFHSGFRCTGERA